jgi:hypothetical protein
MYPLVPLFAAGLLWEGEHLAGMIRRCLTHRDRSQRVAAWVIGTATAAAGVVGVWTQFYMTFWMLPALSRLNEDLLQERGEAYRWIGRHVDPSQSVMASNPGIYLYTGRRTASIIGMSIDWYRHDRTRMLRPFRGISAYAAKAGADYIYLHDSDYGALLPDAPDEARGHRVTSRASTGIPKWTIFNLSVHRSVNSASR